MSIVSSVGNGEEIDFKKTNDKLDKYRKTIEHLKQDNELLSQQLSLLNGEIKNFKAKLEEIKTFDGRFTEYDEFKLSMLKILENYKPKKKEFEELAKKLKDHLNNVEVPLTQSDPNKTSQGNDTKNSDSNKEKKKGFFGKMFTKKEK